MLVSRRMFCRSVIEQSTEAWPAAGELIFGLLTSDLPVEERKVKKKKRENFPVELGKEFNHYPD